MVGNTFIIAKPYLCVAAVLELIIRESYPNKKITQLDIANYFGVGIKNRRALPIQNVYQVENDEDVGIHLEKDSINRFFRDYNLHLQEHFVSIYSIAEYDFEETIKLNLKKDAFLVCGYSYGRLYNIETKYELGHVSIIKNVTQGTIEMLDPGPLNSGYKKVKAEDLYSAIRIRGDGLWIIKSVTFNEEPC